MKFLVRKPVADLTRSSPKNPCDIHLKHVLLAELNLWKNPAYKVHQVLFCLRWYHNIAQNLYILNISKVGRENGRPQHMGFAIISKNQ